MTAVASGALLTTTCCLSSNTVTWDGEAKGGDGLGETPTHLSAPWGLWGLSQDRSKHSALMYG